MTRMIVSFLALVAAAPVLAQEVPKLAILAGGGVALPVTPDTFNENWNTGFDVAGGVSVRLSPKLALQLVVSYDRFTIDQEGPFSVPGDQIEGGETEIVSFTGELKASLVGDPAASSIYVLGGGGIARVSVAERTISSSLLILTPFDFLFQPAFLDPRFFDITLEGKSVTRAMAGIGVGVDIPISNRFVSFVEGRYQFTFTEDRYVGHATIRGGVRVGL